MTSLSPLLKGPNSNSEHLALENVAAAAVWRSEPFTTLLQKKSPHTQVQAVPNKRGCIPTLQEINPNFER